MPKGFEGWVKVQPETGGWGVTTLGEGHYLYADSESLSPNQEFKDRPEKITYGMAEKKNSRTKGAQKPGGDITYQPRSNDCINVFMSHFQKYISGTTSAGTATYTFVPCKTQPDWGGAVWGTGAYTADDGDMFTVKALVKFNDTDTGTDNTKAIVNGFADQLVIESAAGEDLKLTPTFKGKTFELSRTAVNAPDSTGSYSTLTPFEFFEGTVAINGDTAFEITNFSMTSSRNSEDRPTLGDINPTKYDFGRYMCEGVVQLDAPNAVLDHLGSMLEDADLTISGTWYNSSNDYVVVSVPNAKYQPFDVNIAAGDAQTEYGLAWKAYESNDGSTAPVTVKVGATGMGLDFDVE